MTIPDTAVIAEQLVAIEAKRHQFGWDKDPELHLLFQGQDGPDSYCAVKDWPRGQAGEQMAALANNMEAGLSTRPGRYAIDRLRGLAPGLYATAFMTEAWMHPMALMSPQELADYDAGIGPRLADRVGSEEARTVAAYDLRGNGYFYVRLRGKPPEPVSIEELRPGTGVTGRLPEALARILAVLAGVSVQEHVARARMPEWLGGDQA